MTGGVSPDSLEVERTSLRSVGADSSNRRLWFKLRLSHRRGTGRTIRVRAHRRCQGREHPPPRPPPAVGRERDDAARAITTSRRPRTGRMKAAEAAADAARPGVATERRRCRRGTARSDPGGTVTFTAASGHDPHPEPAATPPRLRGGRRSQHGRVRGDAGSDAWTDAFDSPRPGALARAGRALRARRTPPVGGGVRWFAGPEGGPALSELRFQEAGRVARPPITRSRGAERGCRR